MSACELCAHPKREAINKALLEGRKPGVVAAQYKVDKACVFEHRHQLLAGKHCDDAHAHVAMTDEPARTQTVPGRMNQTYTSMIGGEHCPDRTSCRAIAHEPAQTQRVAPVADERVMVTGNPLSQFKHHLGPLVQAYHLAKDDRLMQERMQFLLQEALADEGMGL